MARPWTYPTAAGYHHAMASLAATEANLDHFLEAALERRTEASLWLVAHNLDLRRLHWGDAVGWASRP